jgi:hypothetical protein
MNLLEQAVVLLVFVITFANTEVKIMGIFRGLGI